MNDSIPVSVVDSHVHTRQLKDGIQVYDFHAGHVFDDLDRGGVLFAHEMPNTKPPLTTYDEVKKRIQHLPTKANYGGLYFCYNGKNLEELRKIFADPQVNAYVVGVKIYPAVPETSVTTNFGTEQDMYDFSLEDGSELDEIAKFCSEADVSLTIHCEDPVEKAKLDKSYGTFDDETEPHFVENVAIPLCEKYPKLKFIVAHVSHRRTLDLLKEAWNRGIKNLYVEMTPHHLLLSTEEIREKLGTDAVFGFCHPFIKIDGTHRHALAEVLLEGRYQDQIIYGSDHAPHSEGAKRTKNIGGIPNHQGAQIILAWFRSQGFQMNHPIVQKFFSQNINRVFQSVPEWRNEFRRRAGSILFTPSDYKEGISAPPRIHNGVVVNPWIKLLRPELKEYWVEPRKVA